MSPVGSGPEPGWSAVERVARQNGVMAKRSDQVEKGGTKETDRRREIALVGVAVAVILLAWFALGNTHDVSIRFWIESRKAPLIVVILISGLLGALISALVMRRRPKAKSKE
jgi:uncharacterized integral membrane protein